jgi:hypothetical protein
MESFQIGLVRRLVIDIIPLWIRRRGGVVVFVLVQADEGCSLRKPE